MLIIVSSHPYYGVTAALATKHQKDQFVCGAFSKLGITLVVPDIDTDLLGTFTGEIAREGTPKEVVLKKARMGMNSSGLAYGVASEGSIGPDLVVPFITSDIECMAWVDSRRNLEIVEYHRSLDILAARTVVGAGDSLDEFLKSADFPNHSLIVRAENGAGEIYKGINSSERLDAALKTLFIESEKLIIESDLRAHHSPSRQRNITAVAEKLAARLLQLCKVCQTPGWGEVGYLYGLECSECRNVEARAVSGKIFGCGGCNYREEVMGEKKFVEPAECGVCNP
jgi:hypothetical protein